MLQNFTTIYDEWSPQVLVECSSLRYIGLYCTILFILGVIANPLLIWIILRNNDLINSTNLLIVTLAILNTIGILIELPLVSASAFLCKFTFGKFGCYWESFFMFFIGCSTIYILTFISCVRYYNIAKPRIEAGRKINKVSIIGIVSCCLLALIWALMPIIGWSEYSLEGAMISCSIEWKKRTPSVISFNIMLAIFVYIIPLVILIYTNANIFRIVRLP